MSTEERLAHQALVWKEKSAESPTTPEPEVPTIALEPTKYRKLLIKDKLVSD